ncbi:MAG: hypothetical protein IPN46_09405 [Saprospiraceae bacterium]|nr:hypothetical protein [Saprospiraceae bacterium]
MIHRHKTSIEHGEIITHALSKGVKAISFTIDYINSPTDYFHRDCNLENGINRFHGTPAS